MAAISFIISKLEMAHRAECRRHDGLHEVLGECCYQDLLESLGTMKTEWREAMGADNPLLPTCQDTIQCDPWGLIPANPNHTPAPRIPNLTLEEVLRGASEKPTPRRPTASGNK